MTRLLEIAPCSQGMLRQTTRLICLGGGLAMATYFISGIVSKGRFEIEDLLFAVMLPALGIILFLLHIEIDHEQISKAMRLGRFWHWRYCTVRWNDVQGAEIYRTSKREFLNLKVTTQNGKRILFSLPEGSVGAARFHQLAKCFSPDSI